MKYNNLITQKNKTSKRLGRGIASGKGKTAGRGTKGQGARAGYTKRPGFEGGQNPLMQRLPKLRGFKNHRIKPTTIFTGQLEQFEGKIVDTAALSEQGLIAHPYLNVKVLVGGELTKKVTVKLQAASKGAIAGIQKAGGSFETTPRVVRPKTIQPKAEKK